MNMNEIYNELDAMSIDDLRDLNEAVVHTIKHKRKFEAMIKKAQLNEGDKVWWVSNKKNNRRYDGIILKVNRTKCKILADTGEHLTVPMTMLNPKIDKKFNPNTGGFE